MMQCEFQQKKFTQRQFYHTDIKRYFQIDLSIFNHDNYSNKSAGSVLKFYRSEYPKKLIIDYININTIGNKFEILKSIVTEALDILMIT